MYDFFIFYFFIFFGVANLFLFSQELAEMIKAKKAALKAAGVQKWGWTIFLYMILVLFDDFWWY